MQLSSVFNRKSGVILAAALSAPLFAYSGYKLVEMIDPLGMQETPEKIETINPEIEGQPSIDLDLYIEAMLIETDDLARKYEISVYMNKDLEVFTLEKVFQARNMSEADIQDIRNNSLLHLVGVYVGDNISLALKYGASLDVKGGKGERLDTLILKKGLSRFKHVIEIHNNYGYDIQPLLNSSKDLWKLFSVASFKTNQDDILQALNFMQGKGVDLSVVQEPFLGLDLRKLAERNKAQKIIDFLDKHQIVFSTQKPLSKQVNPYTSYLEYSDAPLISITVDEQKLTDFSMYNKITYNHNIIPDNKRKSVLYIAEHLTPSSVGRAIDHVNSTGGIASAVDIILTEKDILKPLNIITVHQTPDSFGENSLTTLLNYNDFNDYQIVSVSMSSKLGDDIIKKYQEDGFIYNSKRLNRVDKRPFVFYKAIGNEGLEPCVEIDKVSFCVQDKDEKYHHKKTVFVGAARKEKNGDITVEEYSSQYPTFCSYIPYQSAENGALQWYYEGTSFTVPAAAAIEKNLADIFARSASFPEGVVHEDIVMALSLTAQTDGLINEDTKKIIPIFKNIAGFPMTDRCGAGVIQPQKAVDLLTKMVQWTKNDEKIKPTHIQEDRFNLKQKHENLVDGKYVYTLKVPEDGIVTTIRAGLPFEANKRGAVLLQIGNSEPVALNMSSSGLTTAFHFAGYQFKKGETFKLITTKPIKHVEYDWETARPFLDLYTVPLNSPIKKAIEYTRQNRKGLLASKNKI